jgi:nitronate monooxygenase
VVKFDLGTAGRGHPLHVGRTMEAKRGDGMIFINCMEKLTMNAPKETCACASRPHSTPASTASPWPPACTWAASALIEDHPRFRDAKLGIIVSSCARCSSS